MKTEEKISARTGEKYIKFTPDNGLAVFVIPKCHSAAFAVLAVNFGAFDTEYISGDGAILDFPSGTAHFLEHRMFETAEGDAMERYARYGGDANAYTAGDRTCYYFSATDMFYENLKVLLDHVANARITQKSVNKEKGIIIQEIKMYDDSPSWRARHNMMRCLYGDRPISEDIAGNIESVVGISGEILKACRKTAYNPQNMALCVCGDVDIEKIAEIAGEQFIKKPKKTYKRVDEPLDGDIDSEYSSEEAEVSLPLYSVGIKFPTPSAGEGSREFAAVEIIMDILFGKSSQFYSDCYDAGIFEEMSFSYQTTRNAFFAEITGIAKNPALLYEKIKNYTAQTALTGFGSAQFNRAKKSLYADAVRDYDSVEDIADTFVSFYFEGDDMFDYPDIVAGMTHEYAEAVMRRLFTGNNTCLSVISPKEEHQ